MSLFIVRADVVKYRVVAMKCLPDFNHISDNI